MMIEFSAMVSSEIRSLLQSLDDSNSDSIFRELCEFTLYRPDGSILLLQACFDHLNTYGKDSKNTKLHPIYATIVKYFMDEPNFSTLLSESLSMASINEEFLLNLSEALQLSAPEKIGLGLALSDSQNLEIQMCGKNFCMRQIAELCSNPVALGSTELIQQILMFLNRSKGLSKHVDLFMQILSLVQVKEGHEVFLTPFLSNEFGKENLFRHSDLFNESDNYDLNTILSDMETENCISDVISELGYGCTATLSDCKEMLSLFLPLSDATIAKIIGTITRTFACVDEDQFLFTTFRSALGGNSVDQPLMNSWNIDVLVDSIKHIAPGVNWVNVMEKMDHDGFYIPNEEAFSFFMSVYRHVCQDPFPLHAICGYIWKNVEGQLSFLKFSVSAAPEVFTFAHSERQLAYDDTVPGHKGQISRNWSSLDLLEVLCQLAEIGHANFVRSILENPMNICPEVLLLGMAHVNTAYNLIQYEVSSAVLPIVLKNASGNGLILRLWHANPNMLLQGLMYAMEFDPENFTRVLDACQELETLSEFIEKARASVSSAYTEYSAETMEMSCTSLSFADSGNSQKGPQVSTPVQLQQRPISFSDDKSTPATLHKHVKPSQSSSGNPSVALSPDTAGIPKSYGAVTASLAHSSSPGFPRSYPAISAKFGSALNIETLEAAAERREKPIEAPASELQDKIYFLMNNLSLANVDAKAKEFTEFMNEKYFPWFAQYLVMKRASIEPNFHDLYLQFLDKINMKSLNKEIVQATYENCKVLLRSELIKSSSEERSLLKNLGSWLGKLTIGKNQVLRAREIDPKSMIIEAYQKGLMIAVIPFTSKILEPCLSSLAYRPPNPWTMSILKLLFEIYVMPNLKSNLKFVIEVLFKDLGVKFETMKGSSLLTNIKREVENNPDFSNKDTGKSQPQILNEVKSRTSTVNQNGMPLDVVPSPLPGPQSCISQLFMPAPNMELDVVINKELHCLGMDSHFQSVLPIAMDRAIKEIVPEIVQTSVSTATQTAKELVMKDYFNNLDKTIVQNAAHLMVGRLAGSLAYVTCKERLRASISTELRNLLQVLSITSESLEQAIQLLTNDNLDLGCAVIEKASADKAIKIIDAEIATQLSMRRAEGRTYFEASLSVPESLQPKPGYLSHWQQCLYEGFGRLRWQNCPTQVTNTSGLSLQLASSSGLISQESYSSGIVNTAIGAVPQDLEINYEDQDNTNAAQTLSVSSMHVSTSDAPISPSPELPVPEHSRTSKAAELVEPDPPGFHEQVSVLYAEWYQICELPGVNDTTYARYVLRLHHKGLLKGDDISERFFQRLTELSVSHCLSAEVIAYNPSQPHRGQALSFLAIDIYAKLVFSILKFHPTDMGPNKLSLLHKVLAVTVNLIHKDSEEKRTAFNPRPYCRLFVNWLLDLCSLEPVFDGKNIQVLTALANAFHALQPLKIPGFSFAWLELISHRNFMTKLLIANGQQGWPLFQRLLVDLFQFMEPLLRSAEPNEMVQIMYRGILRVLLVVLHDIPEFLCDYHFSFCDLIPPNCIQMRNIVLSAYPRNMKPPKPSTTPNSKIDLMPEIWEYPRILSEVDAALKAKQIKNEVDDYLRTRPQGSSFLAKLKHKLLLSPSDAARSGTHYNVPLINSLVLYVGMQDIKQLHHRAPQPTLSLSMSPILVSSAFEIYQSLVAELDTGGRYLFLNAIANQLRYPNNQTRYFSRIILDLFAQANKETIQDQITRVLVERFIISEPHPWGLCITIIELIKNPLYNFWSRSFTRCSPEIEKLLESVLRSCGGAKPVDNGPVSGGMPDSMY